MKVARIGLAVLLVLGSVVAADTAAAASQACDPTHGIQTSGSSVDTTLRCPGNGGSDDPKHRTTWTKGGYPPLCVWVPQPDYVPEPGQPTAGKDGQWYVRFCRFGSYATFAQWEVETGTWDDTSFMKRQNFMRRAGIEFRFFKTPPPTRPTPEQIMYWVAGTLPFPATHLAVSPKPGANVVNVPTWVWLTDAKGNYNPSAYAVKSKQIALFGYALRWQIVPKVAIDPGDGGTAPSCTGIGVPWSKGADPANACTVSYSKAGRYTMTATVSWTVQWWLGGVQQPDIDGPDNTATAAITVKEIQVVGR
ncbi:hypothetical protein ACQPYH_06315 [Kribbella sp. CA-245084]|uniref:hypothetical protein n=1 Tax=Kribbella sp. CA-245084 TaxID=3239940 RepID=UPI003D8E36B2